MLRRKWTFPSLEYDHITRDQSTKHDEFKPYSSTILPLMPSLSPNGISQFLFQPAGKSQTLNLDLTLKLTGGFLGKKKKKLCTSANSGDAEEHATIIFSPLVLSSLLQVTCC